MSIIRIQNLTYNRFFMHGRTHFIFYCLLTLLVAQANAQTRIRPVERQAIDNMVNDVSLTTFYPILLQRFKSSDPTLTLSEYRLIYYGYIFQPNYSYNSNQRKKQMKMAMQADEYQKVTELADEVLETNPVSLTALYFRAYAMLNANENDPSYKKYIKKYNGLRDAILSSGNGKGSATAFKTIYFEDDYEIMHRYLGIEHGVSRSLQYPCDRFSITPSGNYNEAEIFFDFSDNLIPVKKSRTR